ncbi:hypothetical protein TNCV_449321 [Trichonephila clavipes]|nr:hypothetical protein TNCV_449321 [Trichonephila clavipes]
MSSRIRCTPSAADDEKENQIQIKHDSIVLILCEQSLFVLHEPPIRYSDADCCAVEHGFESRRRHGCSQMYSAFAAGGYSKQPSSRSPLVRLVEGKERWEASDHLQGVLLKIGVEPSQNVLSPVWCSKLRLT